MKKFVTTSLITTSLLFSGAVPVLAGASTYGTSYGVPCTATYGNPCEIPGLVSINKMVLDPKSNTKGGQEVYVENLSSQNNHYAPDQAVSYKLVVTNTGSKTLTNVVVKDTLPAEVTFVSGDGSFANGVFTATIAQLEAGQSKTLIVRGKIVGSNSLPNQSLLCNINNRAQVTADDKTAEDNAQLCVEKTLTVFPAPSAKTTPKTGPEAIALIGLIPGAVSGLLLRKRALRQGYGAPRSKSLS